MSYRDQDGSLLNTRIHWAKEAPRSITAGQHSPGSSQQVSIAQVHHSSSASSRSITAGQQHSGPSQQVSLAQVHHSRSASPRSITAG